MLNLSNELYKSQFVLKEYKVEISAVVTVGRIETSPTSNQYSSHRIL